MTHHIYRTSALVLATTPVAEANRHYYLLTQDLGVISATAQGVRLAKSKLKYALQPLTQCTVSLVKGRYGWKIVNAVDASSLYQKFRDQKEKKGVIIRVLALVRRLVQGEEAHSTVFAMIMNHSTFLDTIEISEVSFVEYSMVVRLLHVLGYMPNEGIAQVVIEHDISVEVIESMKPHKREFVELINKALKATQL